MKTIFGIFPLFNNYTSVWQCMLANSKCISWRKDWNWWGFNSDTFYVLHYSAYYISIFKLQRTAFPGVWCNRVLFIPPAMFSSCIFKCILLTSAVLFAHWCFNCCKTSKFVPWQLHFSYTLTHYFSKRSFPIVLPCIDFMFRMFFHEAQVR